MISTTLIFILIFFILGVPVSFAVGLAGILGVLLSGNGMVAGYIVAQRMGSDLFGFTLLCIPLFMMAGDIMAKAKISERLIRFATAAFCWLRGGVGIVCVFANAIFAGITGSGIAAINSVGQACIPAFEEAKYEKKFYAALIAGGGGLGPIIPPSGTMIMYSLATGMSVTRMFVGGIGPGLLISLGMCVLCMVYAKKHNIDHNKGQFNLKTLLKEFMNAVFALLMPLILMGTVILGVCTPTEAGILACLYGMFVGLFIYKTLTFKDIGKIFINTANASGMILMVIATTGFLSYLFARDGTAAQVADLFSLIPGMDNKYIFYGVLMVFFFVVGIPLEVGPLLRILMPLIYPLVLRSGIDPLVFGISAVCFAVIGNLSPPVGHYIFVSMKATKCPYIEIEKPMWLITFIFMGVVLFSGFFANGIITWLPQLWLS